MQAEVRRPTRTPSIDHTLLQCRSREDCSKRTVLHDTWWHRTWQTEKIMSRVHLASKWGKHPALSSWTLRSWNHERISIWRQNLLVGQDRERNQQTRDGDVGKRLTLKALGTRVQGNLLRRQDHNRHQIPRCGSYIARQSVVTRRLRRAHLSRWKLSRLTRHHPVWIDSRRKRLQEREACGVLYGRKSDVRRSAQRSRLRPDESQNCSVLKSLDNTPTYTILV